MRISLTLIALLLWNFGWSQDSTEKKWSANGYVKFMTIQSIQPQNGTVNQNFFHHRYNFRADLTKNIVAKVEVRNRLFYGEFLKLPNQNFGEMLDMDNGYADMSWTIVDNRNAILHSTIDRAWLNYTNDNWDVGLGRQRINWGINLVWNPNDLFNVLNFTDFDYEERPGTDAFRAQRYFKGGMSKVDFAYKHTGNFRRMVSAIMYKFNRSYYDIQFIAGKFETDAVVGMGWAGSIKSAGFKGEVSYFEPIGDRPVYEDRAVSATIAMDYSFKKGIYFMSSLLYNTVSEANINQLLILGNTASNPLSARQLMPNEYSAFVQVSGPINPLIGLSFASIYAIDINGILVFPTVSYSIAQNMEAALVAQSFFYLKNDLPLPTNHLGSGIFLRFKYSY